MATLSAARRVVVKIGSALLVDRVSGALRHDWLKSLAADVAWLTGQGAQVVIVSSGSIALGRGVLGLGSGTLALEQSQAAAAVGQIRLAQAYEGALADHGLKTAQVLLTLDDSRNRRRYLNARATLGQLMSLNVVPIVNENDTIATDEIRFGDNDRLAAQIAVTVAADRLVLLSDVDGLYTANPAQDAGATHIADVHQITPEIEAMAGDAGSGLSKGGMKTKVMAAKVATLAGCAMAISKGEVMHPLRALHDGARCTWFHADLDPSQARKAWIGSMKPAGSLRIDDGAMAAILRGNSLLPAGVHAVGGAFERGDPVQLQDMQGRDVCVALAGYTSGEAQAIIGRKSTEIEAILGYPGRAALVHRDDMALSHSASEANDGA